MLTKEIKSGCKKHGGRVFVFKFDAEDADLYECVTVHSAGYAVIRHAYVHRLIAMRVGLGDGHVDHVNGDRTDNRRGNLRSATRSLNSRNVAYKGYEELPGGRFRSGKVSVGKPFRKITPIVPVNAFARDLTELKAGWPGRKVLVERHDVAGHRLWVEPIPRKVFDTKEEAIAHYEACRASAIGSHEGRRK